MKRLLYICLAALLTAVSCDKTPEEVAAAITPTGDAAALFTNGLKVAASASTTKVSFTATRDWSVVAEDTKALASWVAVTPASGKAGNCEVTVNVQANPELAERKANVVITSVDLTASFPVVQAAREMVAITSVTLDKPEVSLYAGETATLTATVLPSNTDEDKTVTWTSSNERVATVRNGVVTAVSEGKATITAKAGSKQATCEVTVLHTVVEVASVTLDKENATVMVGETVTLKATVNPDNADDKTVTWTSSNEAVAVVTDGVVTGIALGEATITATAGGKTATCKIVVDKKGSHGEDLGGSTDTDPWNEPTA